jgi:hypothetical protein
MNEAMNEAVKRAATTARARRFSATAALIVLALWACWLPRRWRDCPGRGESERRDAQIARGTSLRLRGVRGATIVPCSFEHFALLAAWGAPERARVLERTGETPTPNCPGVLEW